MMSAIHEDLEILEKQNRLQMSKVFSVSAHLSSGGFAFQGFYSEAASPVGAAPTAPRYPASRWFEVRSRQWLEIVKGRER
jgi:hypothetical protein